MSNSDIYFTNAQLNLFTSLNHLQFTYSWHQNQVKCYHHSQQHKRRIDRGAANLMLPAKAASQHLLSFKWVFLDSWGFWHVWASIPKAHVVCLFVWVAERHQFVWPHAGAPFCCVYNFNYSIHLEINQIQLIQIN